MRLCCGANGAFRENLDGVMRCVTFFFFFGSGERFYDGGFVWGLISGVVSGC